MKPTRPQFYFSKAFLGLLLVFHLISCSDSDPAPDEPVTEESAPAPSVFPEPPSAQPLPEDVSRDDWSAEDSDRTPDPRPVRPPHNVITAQPDHGEPPLQPEDLTPPPRPQVQWQGPQSQSQPPLPAPHHAPQGSSQAPPLPPRNPPPLSLLEPSWPPPLDTTVTRPYRPGVEVPLGDISAHCEDMDRCPESVGSLLIVYKEDGNYQESSTSEWQMSSCSATLINSQEVLINEHCLPPFLQRPNADCRELTVVFPQTRHRAAEKIRCDRVLAFSTDPRDNRKRRDWARLRLLQSTERRAATVQPQAIDHGTRMVSYVSHFEHTALYLRDGQVPRPELRSSIQQRTCHSTMTHRASRGDIYNSPFSLLLAIDCGEDGVAEGNSGSGLFTEQGRLVAVISHKMEEDSIEDTSMGNTQTVDFTGLGRATNLFCVEEFNPSLPDHCEEQLTNSNYDYYLHWLLAVDRSSHPSSLQNGIRWIRSQNTTVDNYYVTYQAEHHCDHRFALFCDTFSNAEISAKLPFSPECVEAYQGETLLLRWPFRFLQLSQMSYDSNGELNTPFEWLEPTWTLEWSEQEQSYSGTLSPTPTEERVETNEFLNERHRAANRCFQHPQRCQELLDLESNYVRNENHFPQIAFLFRNSILQPRLILPLCH